MQTSDADDKTTEDKNKLAQKIFEEIGGVDNLTAVSANISRIKLTLLDPKKFHQDSLLLGEESLLGVLDRLETENAFYIVTKPYIAEPLSYEILKLKDQASPPPADST